jgi:hypothetical protein
MGAISSSAVALVQDGVASLLDGPALLPPKKEGRPRSKVFENAWRERREKLPPQKWHLTGESSRGHDGEEKAKMQTALKTALEELLRTRHLKKEDPPLRGERRLYPFETGLAPVDALLGGGFPRGQVSEVHGPASSGRTGLVLSVVARVTLKGALGAWVDGGDRLDPASAVASGIDLGRLFWLRGGRSLPEILSATSTLLGSGLFDLVVLDLADVPGVGRLPGTTWLRLQRMIEETTGSLILVGDHHVAQSPRGASLALKSARPRFSGCPGPSHLLQALSTEVRAGRPGLAPASLELQVVP